MQSKGENLDWGGGVTPATACSTKCLDWRVAARIFTYRRVRWAIDSFAPYKSPGMDGIFPALLQEGWEILIPYLVRIFCACLATGYVPAMWCRIKVMFIPKPGRSSYCGPRDFRRNQSHSSLTEDHGEAGG